MARGGYRPGAGRPRGSTTKTAPVNDAAIETDADSADDAGEVFDAGLTPLQYALRVMRDPKVDEARRDRMAIACMPFVHRRLADKTIGIKEAAQMAAATASGGRFRPSAPPKNPGGLSWGELLDQDRPMGALA